MSNGPFCACIKVKYSPDQLDGSESGRQRESWKCESCGTRFIRQAFAESQLAAAQKEIAVLSTRLREEKEDNALLIKCETEAESKLSEAQQTIERLKKNIKNK